MPYTIEKCLAQIRPDWESCEVTIRLADGVSILLRGPTLAIRNRLLTMEGLIPVADVVAIQVRETADRFR